MKLIITEDCGNAPSKELIRGFTIAFAENDIDRIVSMMTDDVSWTLVGDQTISGKAKVKKTLEGMSMDTATELTIGKIINSGDRCASNGVMKYEDGAVAFCDIYTLSSGKVREMVSYGIDVE